MVHLNTVTFSYSPDSPVLHELSFRLDKGEALLLVGRNGAGKSTLLRLLNGILRPTKGTITVNGLATNEHPTSALARHVSVTFQNPSHQIFASTVLEETAFGPRSLTKDRPRDLSMKALGLFGLDSYEQAHPYDLSQAQRKLLTLASAVAASTPILAFDEPGVSLSHPERLRLLHALGTLRAEGRTLIIVSHDLDLFLPFCNRLLLLKNGMAEWMGATKDILVRQSLLRKAGVRLSLLQRWGQYYGIDPLQASDSSSIH